MKNKIMVFMLFFIFMHFQSFGQEEHFIKKWKNSILENIKNLTDKVLTSYDRIEEERKSVDEKITSNIDILKYSSESYKKKKAYEFLFENVETVKPYFFKEIFDKTNEDNFLTNMLYILIDSQTSFDINKLIESIDYQINKSNYIQNILLYIYPINPVKTKQTLTNLIESPNFEQKKIAFKLIKTLKITDFKDLLFHILLIEKNYLTLHYILNTLIDLSLNNNELEQILIFLQSTDEGVRNTASLLLSKYPNLFNNLLKIFQNSDNFFEKCSIIETVSYYYDNEKVDDFLFEQLGDIFYYNKVLAVYLKRISSLSVVKKLINAYNLSENIFEKQNMLKVFPFFTRTNPNEKIKQEIIQFLKQEIRKNNEIDILIQVCLTIYKIRPIDDELKKYLVETTHKTNNWIINKTIRQLFDLPQEN